MSFDSAALRSRPAVTVKEISGRCIKTILVGTIFEVIGEEVKPHGYYNCRGLGVSSVWTDEFRFL